MLWRQAGVETTSECLVLGTNRLVGKPCDVIADELLSVGVRHERRLGAGWPVDYGSWIGSRRGDFHRIVLEHRVWRRYVELGLHGVHVDVDDETACFEAKLVTTAENLTNVIFAAQEELEALDKVGPPFADVMRLNRLANELQVKHSREANGEGNAVVDGDGKQQADELKP